MEEQYLVMTIKSIPRYKEIQNELLTIGLLIVCDENGFHLCNPEGKMFNNATKISLEQLRKEEYQYQEYKKNILFSGFTNYKMGGFEWFSNGDKILFRYHYNSKKFYLGKNSSEELKTVDDLERYNLINLKKR